MSEVNEIVLANNIEIDEEIYDITEIIKEETHKNIIRMEMNTIEFPLFTKNKKIKENVGMKYIFNKENDQYLEVKPVINEKIPSEFDERLYIGMLNILREQGYNRKIYFNYKKLMDKSKIAYNGRSLSLVKRALERLGTTSFIFNNCFYSNPQMEIKKNKIVTKILSYRELNFERAIKVDEGLKIFFTNGKIKEIIEVTFDDVFFDNIISKGYLYFNADDLQNLEYDISRSLYTMMTKWRNKNVYLKRYSKFLASRIPLSWKKENIAGSIKSIKRAMEELKEKGLIDEYRFDKNKSNDKSYFEIFFNKKHNKNLYEAYLTGQENFVIDETKEKLLEDSKLLILEDKEEKREITRENFEKTVSFRWQWAKKGYDDIEIYKKDLLKTEFKIIEEE